jgi:outer membrane protein OmpA-like peptidoglycan-associated protein
MEAHMKKTLAIATICLLTNACATDRQVAQNISALEQRRLAVEIALAERVTKVEGVAEVALSTAQAAEKTAQTAQKTAEGKFLYETVLTDTVLFASGSVILDDAAKQRIIELASSLKGSNRNLFIEIEGHTDAVGSAERNDVVGLRRAESVRTFFSEQGVALNRMSTISRGERSPIGSYLTAAGRAANRRVVVTIKR